MACPGDTRETHLVMGPVSQLSGSIITITCFYWIMNLKKKGGRRGDSGGGWVMGTHCDFGFGFGVVWLVASLAS